LGVGRRGFAVSTRIFCLGNELVGDDGVAMRVGRVLRQLKLPDEASVELVAQLGFDLLDLVAGADRVVLVDAMSTGRPAGSCVVLEGRAIERYSAGASASHTVGIAELMELAHRMAPERASATLHFVGIEGAAFGEYSTRLSPEVAAAIPEAVEAVLRVVGAGADLLAQARVLSQRAALETPSIATLLGK
jgi:hydrogenase maturation protease